MNLNDLTIEEIEKLEEYVLLKENAKEIEVFLKNPKILKGMINQFNEFMDGDNGER